MYSYSKVLDLDTPQSKVYHPKTAERCNQIIQMYEPSAAMEGSCMMNTPPDRNILFMSHNPEIAEWNNCIVNFYNSPKPEML